MSSRWYELTGRAVLAMASAALFMLTADIGAAQAQQGAIAGQVTDANNLEPVVGAQVFLPDTDLGALTNDEGRFRITGVPAGSHEIRVRLLGYRPATRSVTVEPGATATVNFQLSVSAVSLGEIVVTQTGERRNRELGRAVTTIDASEEVQKSRSGTIQDLIKGRSTGTIIRSSSGSVGTGNTIQIRGNATLSLDNTPLIYIDGVRVENSNAQLGGMFSGALFTGGQQTSRLSDLNPEDIESIQVLKGPSATTLYGSEAAAGVIVIETKQGRTGDARWSARAEAGGNWDVTDYPGVAWNPTDDPAVEVSVFKDTVYLMNLTEGKQVGVASPFRTGFEQQYGGTVRGGVAEGNINYYVSGSYEERAGNLPANRLEKWNARANLNFSPSDKVDVSLSNGFVSNFTTLPQNDNNAVGYLGNALLGLTIWAPEFRADPLAGGAPILTCPLAIELARLGLPFAFLSQDGVACRFPNGSRPGGPFLALTFQDIPLIGTTDDTQRYTGSGTINYRPWDFFTGRLTVGYDESDQNLFQIWPVTPRLAGVFDDFGGSNEKAKQRNTNLTIQASGTADFQLAEDLTSSTTVGAQYFDEKSDNLFVDCEDFPAGSPACDNSVSQSVSDFFSRDREIGVFFEEQIAWRDIMFLTGGLRIDESGAFGEELGKEFFPQASLSWVMSDEEWFPQFFEQFKLRGAWGQSGSQPGTNAALALLSASPTPVLGVEQIGVSPSRPGNPDLKPARVTEVEAGFDMTLFDGRVSGQFTWYRQTTKDDVVSRPLPPSSGFPGSQIVNIGELVNTGIETSLDVTAFSMPDLTWDWRAQVSTNYNEITKLDNPISFGFGQRHAEGRAFGAYFQPCAFFEDDGSLSREAGGANVFECPGEPGGDPTPNVNASLSTTVTLFNHVTLYALAEAATGHQLQDNTLEFICEFIHRCADVFQIGPDGTPSDDARLKRFASRFNTELNFIDDADYIKLRTVSARFDLPDEWTQFFNGRDVSFQLTGENLAVWTGWRVDPELTSGGQQLNLFQAEFLTVPPARRVTASLQVAF